MRLPAFTVQAQRDPTSGTTMTSNPTPTPTTAADRPPIVRFLLLFIVLLALATGLAAFSFAAEPPALGTITACRACNASPATP